MEEEKGVKEIMGLREELWEFDSPEVEFTISKLPLTLECPADLWPYISKNATTLSS